jgi:hypothetical protein
VNYPSPAGMFEEVHWRLFVRKLTHLIIQFACFFSGIMEISVIVEKCRLINFYKKIQEKDLKMRSLEE